MPAAIRDLTEPIWTTKLVASLERTAAAIGRLDARVSVSSVRSAWQKRASWSGYTTALRGQGAEIDEIDIFGRECGVSLPDRPSIPTNLYDPQELTDWQQQLADRQPRYWRDEVGISTELPEGWDQRPALLRALEITAQHARAEGGIAPWLALPALLRSMQITQAVLPCLTIGDKALRLSPRDTQAILLRNLRSLTDHACQGLERLQAIEEDRLRAAAAVQGAHRPGKLLKLFALLQLVPVVSPRMISQRLDVTISGAGKLLTRAVDLGLVVEVSGRQAWRIYMTRDLAIAFGFVAKPLGRPLAAARPESDLDPALAAFDREMAELDAMLARIGVRSGLGSGTEVSEHG